MNNRRVRFALFVSLAAIGMVLCYRAGRVRADGAPAKGPLVYTGTLEESGQPAMGPRNITINLWDAATDGTKVCSTVPAAPTPLDAGRFSIPLDDSCADAVHKDPDLWIEVTIDNTSIGRTKLGAVPYALEAASAAAATGGLKLQLVPSGTISAFGGKTAPPGWFLCDGTAISRSAYPELFAAIGINWGGGDGVNTFNVPDLRGRFLRGNDAGSMRDPDRMMRSPSAMGGSTGDAVGTLEADALQNHAHVVNDPGHKHVEQIANQFSGAPTQYAWSLAGPAYAATFVPIGIPTAAATTGITVGAAAGMDLRASSETRPANASVSFIIKI